jgi:hypothetical protein
MDKNVYFHLQYYAKSLDFGRKDQYPFSMLCHAYGRLVCTKKQLLCIRMWLYLYRRF